MRKLLIWLGIVFVLVALPMSGIYVLGRPQDGLAQRVLGPTARSAQACWYGICPGTTSLAQSVDRMTALASDRGVTLRLNTRLNIGGYLIPYAACLESSSPKWRSCVRLYSVRDGRIEIDVDVGNSGLILGDLIEWLGPPSSVFMCAGFVPNISSGKKGVAVFLGFADGSVVGAYKFQKSVPAIYPVPADEWVITPGMLVDSVRYYPVTPGTDQPDGETTFRWRGFGKGPSVRYGCGV